MNRFVVMVGLVPLLAIGCARITHEGGERPIHIVHDINIRVDRQLEEFFAFEEREPEAVPAAEPAEPAEPADPVDPAEPAAALPSQPAAPATQSL